MSEGRETPGYALLAAVVATLPPLMCRLGLANESMDVATLETRLWAEAAAHDAVALPPLLITAWCRVPERAD